MKHVLLLSFTFVMITSITYAKNTSCARHGGISYCGYTGQYICNDGSTDAYSLCGGKWAHTTPSLDFTLLPPKKVHCPAHAEYSYSVSNCLCQEGYTPSEDQKTCIPKETPSQGFRSNWLSPAFRKKYLYLENSLTGNNPQDMNPRIPEE